MKIATIPVLDFTDQAKVTSLLTKMYEGKLSEIHVPLPTQEESNLLSAILEDRFSDTQLREIEQTNVQINIHFDQTQINMPAFETIERITTPKDATGPTLTMKQGVIGGAVIGGVGGLGIATLAGLVKTTADSTSNPVLMALAAVATGLAVGATGGAAVALGRDVDFRFGDYGLGLTTPGAAKRD